MADSRPEITDRTALARHRARARALARGNPDGLFLHHAARREIQERLTLVNRSFTRPAIVTAFAEVWAPAWPAARLVPDDEILALGPAAHDLVIHALALHWANDPLGQLIQARRALKPDGLFLGILFGGETLNELRTALAEAEVAVTGGLSPRVLPMGEIRDLGALLQRAGFALPVADLIPLRVSYETPLQLMHDLRAMGETNALAQRHRRPMRRAVLDRALRLYQQRHARDGRITASFDLIVLTGWAPGPGQPKPLRPGSATARLADALGTAERPLGDPVRPPRA